MAKNNRALESSLPPHRCCVILPVSFMVWTHGAMYHFPFGRNYYRNLRRTFYVFPSDNKSELWELLRRQVIIFNCLPIIAELIHPRWAHQHTAPSHGWDQT